MASVKCFRGGSDETGLDGGLDASLDALVVVDAAKPRRMCERGGTVWVRARDGSSDARRMAAR
jgi:hypothetical protein|tara:strand:+ start:1171 stop:1359 length:189 start_codon:yes stop_codon:yes gene_type:complete